MTPTDTIGAPDELEGDHHFVVGTASWPEEVLCLWGALHNYAEGSLRLHRQHGLAFPARLPGPVRRGVRGARLQGSGESQRAARADLGFGAGVRHHVPKHAGNAVAMKAARKCFAIQASRCIVA